MKKQIFLYILFFASILGSESALSQTNQDPFKNIKLPPGVSIPEYARTGYTPFTVRKIYLSGNKRTRPYIILREIPFSEGDTMQLTQLASLFEKAQHNLMNIALFNGASLSFKSFDGHNVDVIVEVKERWYLFPLPYLKPVDRNLNVWLKDEKLSFERVNYGLKFNYYNFTGRRDELKLYLISGYTQNVSLSYSQPFTDKKLQHGFNISMGYSRTREINYANLFDKQLFYKDTIGQRFQRSQFNVNIGYTYRPGVHTIHSVRLGYTDEKLLDSVALNLNPNYFGNGRMRIRYPELSYSYNYFDMDYLPYPERGYRYGFTILKRGITEEAELWYLGLSGSRYWPLSKNTLYSIAGSAQLKFPFRQPYYNSNLMGFGDQYLRGLERFVVEGNIGLILKQTLRQKLLAFSIPTFIKSKSHDRIPFRIYAKVYGDMGYAYNKYAGGNGSRLNNKLLYSGGFGLDIITFYDFVLKLEYSFNQLRQRDLYFHSKSD